MVTDFRFVFGVVVGWVWGCCVFAFWVGSCILWWAVGSVFVRHCVLVHVAVCVDLLWVTSDCLGLLFGVVFWLIGFCIW